VLHYGKAILVNKESTGFNPPHVFDLGIPLSLVFNKFNILTEYRKAVKEG
jgi:hypothetical protein